jgi:hypothetical protein
MLGCEWCRMRKARGTLLSGHRTELTYYCTRCPPTTQTNLSNSSFPFARFFHMGQFIPNSVNPQRDPNMPYTFDSERGASQSEICRQGKNKECIIVRLSVQENNHNRRLVDTVGGKKQLQMTARELFAAMQVRVLHLSSLFTAPTAGCFVVSCRLGVTALIVIVSSSFRRMASFVRCPWIQLGHT